MTATKKPFAIIPRDHTDAAVKTVIRGTDEIVLVSLKFGNEAKFCKLIVIFSDLQYKDIRYTMKLVQGPMKRILITRRPHFNERYFFPSLKYAKLKMYAIGSKYNITF